MNYYSSPDMLGLVAELNERRIKTVLGTMAKRNGGVLSVSDDLVQKLAHVREMHRRYLRGEYSHTERDESIVVDVMVYLVYQHAKMHRQPAKTVEIDRSELRSRNPAEPQTYQQARRKVHQEW